MIELCLRPTPIKMRAVAKLMTEATTDTSKPTPHGFERLRIHQALDGGIADADRCQQDQETLESAGEILGLAMSVGVIVVRRKCRQRQHPQGHQRPREIHEGLDGVRQQPDRTGQPPRHALEQDGGNSAAAMDNQA